MKYVITEEARLCFVVPHIEGTPLSELIEENDDSRLPESAIKFTAFQLVLAIGALHSKGIILRNVTAESIVMEDDGYIKISRFGHAQKLDDDENLVGLPAGSIGMHSIEQNNYRAPEMFDNQEYNKIVDWWSLGILMYKLLIGITPFSGKNEAALLS